MQIYTSIPILPQYFLECYHARVLGITFDHFILLFPNIVGASIDLLLDVMCIPKFQLNANDQRAYVMVCCPSPYLHT